MISFRRLLFLGVVLLAGCAGSYSDPNVPDADDQCLARPERQTGKASVCYQLGMEAQSLGGLDLAVQRFRRGCFTANDAQSCRALFNAYTNAQQPRAGWTGELVASEARRVCESGFIAYDPDERNRKAEVCYAGVRAAENVLMRSLQHLAPWNRYVERWPSEEKAAMAAVWRKACDSSREEHSCRRLNETFGTNIDVAQVQREYYERSQQDASRALAVREEKARSDAADLREQRRYERESYERRQWEDLDAQFRAFDQMMENSPTVTPLPSTQRSYPSKKRKSNCAKGDWCAAPATDDPRYNPEE